ncbi:DoxX family protein, partial [Klebsiella pneumoniae]
MLMAGLLSRFVALTFVGEMLVAMLSTKITMYLGTSPLALPSAPPQTGGWAVLHEIRSEYAQLICCAFVLWVGPGAVSLDAWRRRRKSSDQREVGASSALARMPGRDGLTTE